MNMLVFPRKQRRISNDQRYSRIFSSLQGTPLKINMELKNEGLEDDFPFQTGDFRVPC